jgi:hypothetical protein
LRRFLLRGAGLSCAAALMLTLATPADARSCSERLKTCQGFCAKTESGFTRVPREMRRVPAILPRERLLGEQVRVQGVRLRQAVEGGYSNARAPSFTACSGATHLKPAS